MTAMPSGIVSTMNCSNLHPRPQVRHRPRRVMSCLVVGALVGGNEVPVTGYPVFRTDSASSPSVFEGEVTTTASEVDATNTRPSSKPSQMVLNYPVSPECQTADRNFVQRLYSRFAFLAFLALLAFFEISNLRVLNTPRGFDSRRLHNSFTINDLAGKTSKQEIRFAFFSSLLSFLARSRVSGHRKGPWFCGILVLLLTSCLVLIRCFKT
jgi:hypothetical protein